MIATKAFIPGNASQFTYGLTVHLYYRFLEKFFQNFWSFLRHSFSEGEDMPLGSDFVLDKFKATIWCLGQTYSISVFLIVHSPLFLCVGWLVLNRRFYNRLIIFVCVGCPRLVLNQRFYSGLFIAYFWMRHFIHEMTKQTPQPTFFNDVFTTYLRPSFGRTSVPKTTLFNDVCTTYFLYA